MADLVQTMFALLHFTQVLLGPPSATGWETGFCSALGGLILLGTYSGALTTFRQMQAIARRRRA